MDRGNEYKEEVIGALIGLVRACESHEPLTDTTALLQEGLLAAGPFDLYSQEQLQELAGRIREHKYRIVPNCRTCLSPCGNTSDFNMKELEQRTPEKQKANRELLWSLQQFAAKLPDHAGMEEAMPLYQGLAAISFDWEVEELQELTFR